MFDRISSRYVRCFNLSSSFFVVAMLALNSPAYAQEADGESAKTTEELLADIAKLRNQTKAFGEAQEAATDPSAKEGFGPFISLNDGEELLAEIHFDSGSTQPTYVGRRKIEHVLEELKASNPTELRIVGFTDRSGSKELNRAISEARAANVALLLSQHGVDIPVVLDARGEENLLYPTPDGETEPLNRCVGIIVKR